ncbi:MAG: bifunctional UDP-sugar hydrolase/5'-nucleotidase [Oscillospiraceae bacterium]
MRRGKNLFGLGLGFALLLSLLVGCSPKAPALPEKDIAILYTTDVHCGVDDAIGYAGLAAYRQELASDGSEVLLVDSGDAIQGAPIGGLSKGETIIEIMNEMGYAVAIPGNHEFDYGTDRLLELSKLAKFPYLSANFVNTETGEKIFEPYTIKDVAGVKIGFVGVTTPLTLTSSNPAGFKNEKGDYIYGFMSDEDGTKLYEAVQKAVNSARKEGADYIVVLSHLGIGTVDEPYTSNSLIEHCSNIDAVLDGHTHQTVSQAKVLDKDGKEVLLTQAGTKLDNIGELHIGTDGALGSKLVSSYEKKDPATDEFVKAIQAKYAEFLSQKVAKTANELTINDPLSGARVIRNAETNLGNLCADAYRAAGKTDIAIINGGGVRAQLPKGDINYNDILSVFPFSNGLCTIEASGQEILDALEHGVRLLPEENGGFLQVSGLSFVLDPAIPSPVRVDAEGNFVSIEGARRVSDVLVSGKPLEPTKTYTLTSHSFLIKNGGDGFTMFMDNKLLQDGFVEDYISLIDYLAGDYSKNPEQYKEPFGEGRITAKQP